MAKQGFLARVYRIASSADLVLEIADARFPQLSRNKQLEEFVREKGKKLVIVLNKSDLASKRKSELEKNKIMQEGIASVFVSSKEKQGGERLRKEIGKNLSKGKIAIVGYPNTGKSSIINLLKGKSVAKTARKAGFTRGEQLVKLKEGLYLIDTPGIIPFKERNEFLLAVIGSKNPEQLKDKENTALELIEMLLKENAESIGKCYGVKAREKNPEEVLEEIALKKGRLMKGGIADLNAASAIIINDWQKGKLRI